MADDLRKSGIEIVGDIPWGTHFCQFYENKGDLLDVLVPYFRTGLEQNELCVWGTFDPLDEQEAAKALQQAIPHARARLAAGDIEIVPQSQLVHDWEAKLEKALAHGYSGMRVNLISARLAQKDQRVLDAYEKELTGFIANRRVIMLCAYPTRVSRAGETSDGFAHHFAIARQDENWQFVETPELRHSRNEVKRLSAELERCASERKQELAKADIDRKRDAAALNRAEEALRASGARSHCYFGLKLVGMAIVSPTKGCIEVNDRLCDMLGYERLELMKTPWAALVHPDDLAVDIRNYDRMLAGAVDGYQIEKRWIRKSGDIVHTNASLNCQRLADGSIDYFAAMVEEVTGPGPTPLGTGDEESRTGLQLLSDREREVARLIGFGRTVKEIAAGLALSEKTVSTYRTRILTKLNLTSTPELIRFALKNRLAE